jgi:hypothetical protein
MGDQTHEEGNLMMMPLPEAIIAIWTPFAALFTQPVWCHVQVLWMGAILCRGPRTVAAVLRVMGLGVPLLLGPLHHSG